METLEKLLKHDDRFKTINRFARFMEHPTSPILGRDEEIQTVRATLNNPEISNALLLAEPGVGKSALVSAMAESDEDKAFFEIDVGLMSASDKGEDGALQMSPRLKRFFNEVEVLSEVYQEKELIFFIDEFHVIMELSTAAAQAIKPILARSGRYDIKLIAATTYGEYHKYIEFDAALTDRWVRINLYEPEKPVIINILKSFVESHNVAEYIKDDTIYDSIVDYTDRYMVSRAQPRKSVQVLDQMIGWHRTDGSPINRDLLSRVIYSSTGIKVNVHFDGAKVKGELNRNVLNQKPAVDAIERRLQIATADLHDETRPMASFLFTGTTGVGKTEMAKQLTRILFDDDRALIRFDMSEYSESSAVHNFRSEVTSEVWNRSHSILLFDEVEKAAPEVTKLMLQLLDDGRLSNREGRQVSFLNTYIILTTNAATSVYTSASDYLNDEAIDSGRDVFKELMPLIERSLRSEDSFPAELLGRVDEIVPFIPLNNTSKVGILQIKLRNLSEKVQRKHGVRLVLDKKIIDYLILDEQIDDPNAGGARDIARRLNSEIVSKIARYINTNPSIKEVAVNIEGTMQHTDKTKRVSEAKVVVGEYVPSKSG